MKCKSCRQDFEPFTRNGIIISRLCAKCLSEKGKKKLKKEQKENLKTKSEWLNDFQKVFNTYIRVRDLGKPCISCGNELRGKYDAGHFFSVGAYPNLRFNEDNVHGQCVFCNQHKHGNIGEYSINLPNKIGVERFETLKSERGKPLKLSISEIKEGILVYKEKTKQILNKQ